MRTRKEIEEDLATMGGMVNNSDFLEILLDIRDLLSKDAKEE